MNMPMARAGCRKNTAARNLHQVKGMEMAAYDPRGAFGQGLAYAVANVRRPLFGYAFPYGSLFGLPQPAATSRRRFCALFRGSLCRGQLMQTCLFSTLAYVLEAPIVKLVPKPLLAFVMQFLPEVAIALIDDSVFTRMISSMLCYRVSKNSCSVGLPHSVLERYMNVREGVSEGRYLPARFLTEGRRSDPQQRVVPLDEMLDDYYRLRVSIRTGFLWPDLLKLGIPLDAAPAGRTSGEGYAGVEPSAAAPALFQTIAPSTAVFAQGGV